MISKFDIGKPISAVLPCDCLLCGQSSHGMLPLCESCDHDLPRQGNQCQGCAYPLTQNHDYCGRCLTTPNNIYATRAAFRYEGAIIRLLYRFKFKADLEAGRVLARLTANRLKGQLSSTPDYILGVPLHWRRLMTRGFNQSLLIAKTIAQQFGVPLLRSGCTRVRHTPSQSLLRGEQRTRNVKLCFAVQSNIANCHLAIVDDIYTTGSTTYALADSLMRSGAAHVEILCCARAVFN